MISETPKIQLTDKSVYALVSGIISGLILFTQKAVLSNLLGNDEIVITGLWVSGAGIALITQRTMIAKILSTSFNIMIKDFMDREKNVLHAYENQKVIARAELEKEYNLVPKDKDRPNSESIPSINTMNHQLQGVQSDLVMLTAIINKEREDILKMLEESQCPEEVKDRCIADFLARPVEKVINGHLKEA